MSNDPRENFNEMFMSEDEVAEERLRQHFLAMGLKHGEIVPMRLVGQHWCRDVKDIHPEDNGATFAEVLIVVGIALCVWSALMLWGVL